MTTSSETTIFRVSKIKFPPVEKFEKDADGGSEFYILTIVIIGSGQEIILKLFSDDRDGLRIEL